MDILIAIAATMTGYLLGSISFARVVARLFAPGENIAETDVTVPQSSRKLRMNAVSATSVRTQMGGRKIFLPALSFRLAFPGAPYFLLVAAMGVIGHNWPLYYRFKGGYGMCPSLAGCSPSTGWPSSSRSEPRPCSTVWCASTTPP
jgi:glycerol-3-phosphate acyltransferase PlsY